jgi:hypothetical protein
MSPGPPYRFLSASAFSLQRPCNDIQTWAHPHSAQQKLFSDQSVMVHLCAAPNRQPDRRKRLNVMCTKSSGENELHTGMEVEVEWSGAWWPARVLETGSEQGAAGSTPGAKSNTVRIQYEGNSAKREEEWVSYERVRPKLSAAAFLVRGTNNNACFPSDCTPGSLHEAIGRRSPQS